MKWSVTYKGVFQCIYYGSSALAIMNQWLSEYTGAFTEYDTSKVKIKVLS